MSLDVSKIIINQSDDYLFNILNIDNYNKKDSIFFNYYNHIKKFDKKIKGDLLEFGVFQGRSLLSTALLLKKINSKKKIYAFDTFKGFPKYSEYDQLTHFKNFKKEIQEKHYITKKVRSLFNNSVNIKNISSSKEFVNSQLINLRKKIRLLKLDNIRIIQGEFSKTIPVFLRKKRKIFSLIIDCDLYDGYKVVLENIYPHLEKKGYIHLDEYYSPSFPGPKIAVDAFCKKNKVKLKVHKKIKGQFPRYYLSK